MSALSQKNAVNTIPHALDAGLSHAASTKAYALMARHGITPIEDLSSDKGLGTSVHLGELGGERVVTKILTPGSNEEMGRDVLMREQMALEANLKGLPRMMKVLQTDGSLEGVCRSFHPGSPVTVQVASGNLSMPDFERALRKLLRSYEEQGFFLEDTDASNFIIAAEFGIVNPAAVHRTLMLVDPEALAHISRGICLDSGEDSVQKVLRSLRAHLKA